MSTIIDELKKIVQGNAANFDQLRAIRISLEKNNPQFNIEEIPIKEIPKIIKKLTQRYISNSHPDGNKVNLEDLVSNAIYELARK